jgi:hypothetical protein
MGRCISLVLAMLEPNIRMIHRPRIMSDTLQARGGVGWQGDCACVVEGQDKGQHVHDQAWTNTAYSVTCATKKLLYATDCYKDAVTVFLLVQLQPVPSLM